jgi:PAS domain S-box-containing protein
VLAVDPHGAIIYWNPAAEAMFGLPRQAMLGRRIEQVIPGGLPAQDTASRTETLGRRADGQTFPVELSLAPWGQAPLLRAARSSCMT